MSFPIHEIAKNINRIRRLTAVRTLAVIDAATNLPSPVLQIILQHLSTSLYPPQLLKDVDPQGETESDIDAQVVQEVRHLLQTNSSNWSVFSIGQNPRHLHAFIRGPESSVYEKGLFQMEIKIPKSYPATPPKLRYLTNILHEDVDNSGSPNLEKIVGTWSNAYSVSLVFTALQVQLSRSQSIVEKREHWQHRAREMTKLYALWPQDGQNFEKLDAVQLSCCLPEYRFLQKETQKRIQKAG
mmetsp:Transcript_34350/g.83124  ORF Transcript_34350/g.83124 Transcript_34350/m.83124 type:complete len:241 (-) Transcript_34350:466-1188(-)|eukprot:CAMPEP_0114491734 /NCGR_PEP_ID=MMETSP0109-20121206/3171_1 /TAXON_ID=29199 /ORGANISM="Chlorarachnion reptans, Strain CCCM449" /LENGTH=240 /DNA_ID=CAMNT_0001668513 /DNA_START=436 /DNA_END=1158 /DNA_ORIENTATION=-